MKKSLVTSVVTITFILYSFYQRTFGMQTPSDIAPSMGAAPSNNTSQNSQSSNSAQPPAARSILPNRSNQFQSSQSPTAPASPQSSVPQNTPAPSQTTGGQYKDGTYTGVSANAHWGNIQVQATIADGKITNVQFLQYPSDRSRSLMINRQATPWLAQEAIQAQSANVRIISGATDSSRGFVQSLSSALSKAKA